MTTLKKMLLSISLCVSYLCCLSLSNAPKKIKHLTKLTSTQNSITYRIEVTDTLNYYLVFVFQQRDEWNELVHINIAKNKSGKGAYDIKPKGDWTNLDEKKHFDHRDMIFMKDINNDGYNDIELLTNDGTERSDYAQWLYQPKKQTFIFHTEKSD